VWGREANGLVLTFHLAGINDQNFLMRDDETGTYWQQISGRAISGPMQGAALKLIHSDELTFAVWKSETPDGLVLKDIPRDVHGYAPKDWVQILPNEYAPVLNFPEHGLEARDIMLGLDAGHESRAYLYKDVRQRGIVNDRLASNDVLLIVGPDGESVRAFHAPGQFFRTPGNGFVMIDDTTGSQWNFQGCAVNGKLKGTCMEPLDVMKDFWFDWRKYHPATSVYSGPGGRIDRR
jgi:hypothetical protein